ncbi:hypothetical protein FHX74_000522 [Friedmanniella endophytica]|uniref:PLD phosphodiesterase domain-containing protein n=1 Tax=Microlunatus kandeliicorticis TaxID=1759536 RepID=A0A7W3P4H8_9ACTN|nr:DISARM system phospholipase D-like protein DrmC [Microlunatus kandeliicorticis]MBA8792928.1 hypothetical protein [Microlunatus kandeliicorticis]
MASSSEPSASGAIVELGRCLTGTEARNLADGLVAGESLTGSLKTVDPSRRATIRSLIAQAGLPDLGAVAAVCRAIEGARSRSTRIDPLWTMPGQLAQTGPLTSSIPQLVNNARTSIVCSTYNFQQTSGLWAALREAAQRDAMRVRVYLDTQAADPKSGWTPPSPAQVAEHLAPARVFRTRSLNGKLVRNHAKYLVVDHRFVLVTSANFSKSAEYANVEFGVRIDSPNLAESVERDILAAEPVLYERVFPDA